MYKPLRIIMASLIVTGSLLASPVAGFSQDTRIANVQAVHCPTLQLKHWRASSPDEKMAFLFGFATMLEMEREWQGTSPHPINRSLTNSWSRGLAGVSLGQMAATVDRYIDQHPDQMDKSVIEVLGMTYVRPGLTPQERNQAARRYQEIVKRR